MNLRDMKENHVARVGASHLLERLSVDVARVDKSIRTAAAREESLKRMRKHPRTSGAPHIPQRYQ